MNNNLPCSSVSLITGSSSTFSPESEAVAGSWLLFSVDFRGPLSTGLAAVTITGCSCGGSSVTRGEEWELGSEGCDRLPLASAAPLASTRCHHHRP